MSFSFSSRRAFLQQASAAAALGVLPRISDPAIWRLTPEEMMPEQDDAILRKLALVALDAARAAGAEFADVRIIGGRLIDINGGFYRPGGVRPSIGWPRAVIRTAYGVRTFANGAWGFASGTVLDEDAVTQIARTAVGRARAARPRHARPLELAPAPRVPQGRWATPIERDPFTVPVREQADLVLAALAAAEGVRGVERGGIDLEWSAQLRVFASSEGSSIVQRVTLARPEARLRGRAQEEHVWIEERPTGLRAGGYGYEAVSAIDLVSEMRKAGERAVAHSRMPRSYSPTDVGRYDMVFSASSAAGLVRHTLGQALDLERALGYRANQEGTSFAAPPADILGRYQIGSPLLTLRADRSRPHGFSSTGWDDDGMATGDFALVEGGVIQNYFSSRQTACDLPGSPPSTGCASGGGSIVPEVCLPNLTLAPGKDDVSVDDLIRDTKRGFFFDSPWYHNYWTNAEGVDQQLFSGQFAGYFVREIRDGKITTPVKNFAFQFLTPQFWKKLDAVGGPASTVDVELPVHFLRLGEYSFWRQDPAQQLTSSTVSAVPIRVKDVNVLNTGRTA